MIVEPVLVDRSLANFFPFRSTNGKLGLNKTRLTDQSLDFGSIGQSYFRFLAQKS